VRSSNPRLVLGIGVLVVILLAVVPPAIGGYMVRGLTSYMIFGLLAQAVGLITGFGHFSTWVWAPASA